MNGFIYKITNDINNNIYVGQTSNTINFRWKSHLYYYRYFKYPLYNAMRKYGTNHFTIQKIEECEISMLNDREKYWIKYYDSYKNGYNATSGGEGCPKYDYNYLYYLWKEGYCLIDISKKTGAHPDVIGKILRNKGITKTEIYHRGAGHNNKMVGQYDKKTHKLLNVYPSLSEAARQVGGHQANISKCCLNKIKSSYGYNWKYVDNKYNIQEKKEIERKYRKK